MKIGNTNNQPSFGTVRMSVKGNKGTQILEKCEKYGLKLLKEEGNTGNISPMMLEGKGKPPALTQFDFYITCKKEDGAADTSKEQKLVKRLRQWAKRNDFNADVSRYDNAAPFAQGRFAKQRKYDYLTDLYEGKDTVQKEEAYLNRYFDANE